MPSPRPWGSPRNSATHLARTRLRLIIRDKSDLRAAARIQRLPSSAADAGRSHADEAIPTKRNGAGIGAEAAVVEETGAVTRTSAGIANVAPSAASGTVAIAMNVVRGEDVAGAEVEIVETADMEISRDDAVDPGRVGRGDASVAQRLEMMLDCARDADGKWKIGRR